MAMLLGMFFSDFSVSHYPLVYTLSVSSIFYKGKL